MSRNKLTIIYDLETTGFKGMPMFSCYHKVIQICALCIETNLFFAEFIDPQFRGGIPTPSTKIHNITNEDIKRAYPLDIVLKRMYNFFCFEKYKQVEMIAHNNQYFDELMLMKEYNALKNISFMPKNIVFWDTLPWLRDHYTFESYNLGNLYKTFFKKDFENAHRADADVLALKEIYVNFILPERFKENDSLSEIQLIEQMIKNDTLTSIRFMGDWRAYLCYKHGKVHTVNGLRKFANELISNGDLKAFDKWLRDKINIQNITQRFFIVGYILDIPLWFDDLRNFIDIVADEDCINDIDYYVKYRYVLNEKAPNVALYNRGLMKLFHKVD